MTWTTYGQPFAPSAKDNTARIVRYRTEANMLNRDVHIDLSDEAFRNYGGDFPNLIGPGAVKLESRSNMWGIARTGKGSKQRNFGLNYPYFKRRLPCPSSGRSKPTPWKRSCTRRGTHLGTIPECVSVRHFPCDLDDRLAPRSAHPSRDLAQKRARMADLDLLLASHSSIASSSIILSLHFGPQQLP
jgi:hypothetical protein